MPPSYIAILTVTLLSWHWVEGTSTYNVEIKKDWPLEPCDLEGFTNIDTIFDFTNTVFSRDDDDLYVNGSFKFKKDVGILEMNLEGKQLNRGNWVTFMSVTKPDYCEFIIAPSEGAEIVFKNLEPKRCPFDTDTVYTMGSTALTPEFSTPYDRAQGELMLTIKFFNKIKGISSCVKIFCELH